MTTYAQEDLKRILDLHGKWLRGEDGGERADLVSADLVSADLRHADLRSADLWSADLVSADLVSADLRYADLRYADLRSADLRSADLRYADLRYADLRSADLRSADLRYADLRSADLRYADLVSADLRHADLRSARLTDGVTWEEYLQDLVPALLTAGGLTLAEVATPEVWECHSWTNCPMATAFRVCSIEQVPALYRWQAERFVQFFDAGLIPLAALLALREDSK